MSVYIVMAQCGFGADTKIWPVQAFAEKFMAEDFARVGQEKARRAVRRYRAWEGKNVARKDWKYEAERETRIARASELFPGFNVVAAMDGIRLTVTRLDLHYQTVC